MKPLYKTSLLLFLNSSFLVFNSFSQQAPGIQWQNTIGGNNVDNLSTIRPASDSGYICGGSSNSNISADKTENCLGSYDYWVIKFNSTGNVQWQNTIGGNSTDILQEVLQTFDGSYICGGNSYSNISGDKTENCIGGVDYWIVKLDPSGNILWQNTIGGSSTDDLNSISQTSDMGYICGGWSTSNISGDKTENCKGGIDYWILKLDSAGNIQWQKTIGGSNDDLLYSISQTSDGGYICGGQSNSNISGDKLENRIGYNDYWVIKLDSAGTIEWQNTIGGTGSDELFSISQNSDGGFICGGFSDSNISGDKTENSLGIFDYWVIKLDSSGTIQWQNTIGGNSVDYLYSISQVYDGGFICGGLSTSNISGDKSENNMGSANTSDYWIVKLDSFGNILWQNTIGGTGNDILLCTFQTKDTGFVCGGYSRSTISGDKTEDSLGGNDYWIVKLLPDTITSISNLQILYTNFQISPNPTTGIFRITFPSSSNQKTNYTLEVINTLGQKVFSSDLRLLTSDLRTNIDVSFLHKGIYFIELNTDNNFLRKKLVVQ